MSPQRGRFFTSDPYLGVPFKPATLHRYAYAANDPVNRIDSTGRMAEEEVEAAGIEAEMNVQEVELAQPVKELAEETQLEENLAIEEITDTETIVEAEGEGWTSVNESMSARAEEYQAQITGRPGESYVQDGVKFDGYDGEKFIDAKGPGYGRFVDKGTGTFKSFFRGAGKLVEQAQRQLSAARGIPIQWHVAEEPAAQAIGALLEDAGIEGIEIVFTPPVP